MLALKLVCWTRSAIEVHCASMRLELGRVEHLVELRVDQRVDGGDQLLDGLLVEAARPRGPCCGRRPPGSR